MPPQVNIDFETRSTIDLKKTGVYPYAAHPTTDIWCMAVAFDDEEPEIWQPNWFLQWGLDHQMDLESRLKRHILGNGEIHAWNANFERNIWRSIMTKRYGWPEVKHEQWHCTMARAAAYALPQQLAQAAEVLNMDEQKDDKGHRLMMQMSKPRAIAEDGTVTWWDDAERLEKLFAYCKQDIRTERAIGKKLKPLSSEERQVYLLDQTINDRGVYLDIKTAKAALSCAGKATLAANQEMARITDGVVNAVTEVAGITEWVKEQGVPCDSIAKDALAKMLALPTLPEKVRQVLNLRSTVAKSSVAKIQAMLDYASLDNFMRGMLQYHVATTGRWGGRGPQPQNAPRGVEEIAELIELYLKLIVLEDLETMACFHPIMEILSTALRSLFLPHPRNDLFVADFAAIEARVLPWLAGEEYLLDLFRAGKDPYKSMASSIYSTPVYAVTKAQRFMGKVAILQNGYQSGHVGFQASCESYGVIIQRYSKSDILAIREKYEREKEYKIPGPYITGLMSDAMKTIKTATDEVGAYGVVQSYRSRNQKIVALWKSLEQQAMAAVRGIAWEGTSHVRFYLEDEWLMCELPNGRTLKYAKPKIVTRETPFGEKDSVQIMGFNALTRKWERQYPYGGLWAENITQAVARDLLCESMFRVEAAGYQILLTVHDEVVAQKEKSKGDLKEFLRLMCEVPAWASGCPIAAEAWVGDRYKK